MVYSSASAQYLPVFVNQQIGGRLSLFILCRKVAALALQKFEYDQYGLSPIGIAGAVIQAVADQGTNAIINFP